MIMLEGMPKLLSFQHLGVAVFSPQTSKATFGRKRLRLNIS